MNGSRRRLELLKARYEIEAFRKEKGLDTGTEEASELSFRVFHGIERPLPPKEEPSIRERDLRYLAIGFLGFLLIQSAVVVVRLSLGRHTKLADFLGTGAFSWVIVFPVVESGIKPLILFKKDKPEVKSLSLLTGSGTLAIVELVTLFFM